MGDMKPIEQKHPNDRKHLWDYKVSHLHDAPVELSKDYPRAVTKGDETKIVINADEHAAATADGWI